MDFSNCNVIYKILSIINNHETVTNLIHWLYTHPTLLLINSSPPPLSLSFSLFLSVFNPGIIFCRVSGMRFPLRVKMSIMYFAGSSRKCLPTFLDTCPPSFSISRDPYGTTARVVHNAHASPRRLRSERITTRVDRSFLSEPQERAVLRGLRKCAPAANETFYYDAYRFNGNATDGNRRANTFEAHSTRDIRRINKKKKKKKKGKRASMRALLKKTSIKVHVIATGTGFPTRIILASTSTDNFDIRASLKSDLAEGSHSGFHI